MKSEEIKKIVIFPEVSLKAAMKAISAGRCRVLFIVNDEDKLLGSLTDGDIRRAILNGIKFERPISEIMFKFPRIVRCVEKDFKEKAKKYVLEERLYAIPVLDKTDRIVDVLFWYDFFEKHPHETHIFDSISNPVVIMAGGKGERLDPFTKILPKPLIPFGDKPIIEKIMGNFNKYGFTNFILTLNYKKEIIKMFLMENQFPYNIECVEEPSEYLGTAGGLGLLKDKLKETFFVSNCDVIIDSDFKNILLSHKGDKALMTLIGCHKEMIVPYGTLEVDGGRLKSINEKPSFDMIINTGVYIMEPEVLKLILPGERLDMDELIVRATKEGKVTVFPVCDGWFDLGQWKEYRDSLYLLQNGNENKRNID